MQKKMCCVILALGFILVFAGVALCDMSSANFSIPTSVVSGGGAPMTSINFQTDSTLGQSSPLMDPDNPPWSTSYELFPGFWYTLETGVPECTLPYFAAAFGSVSGDTNYNSVCDFEPDGDVDGSDLAVFAAP